MLGLFFLIRASVTKVGILQGFWVWVAFFRAACIRGLTGETKYKLLFARDKLPHPCSFNHLVFRAKNNIYLAKPTSGLKLSHKVWNRGQIK